MKSIYKFKACLIIVICLLFHSVIVAIPVTKTVTSTSALAITVSGKVTDAGGSPIPGVNVRIKGSNMGAVTDADGNYRLTADENAVLLFSAIGFITQEISVNGRSVIDVVLSEDVRSLDEVVIVGYGSVRKSDLTGSVSSVKSEELEVVPATSIDQALQGRAAGVQITQTSGQPGGGTSIRIRGTSSITAGNEPLYVIDGMLINSDDGSLGAGVSATPAINALATINPNDIESIEVLKDASATAIYGSRGANGVILITTKKGTAGKGTVNFDVYYGFQEISNKINVLNGEQYATMINEANTNVGLPPEFADPSSLGEGTDWQDEIFRVAPISNYSLSFLGGDEKTQYAVIGSYFNQEGIIINSDFDRLSFRVNVDRKINDRLTLGNNLAISRITSNGVTTNANALRPGVSSAALFFNPNLPVFDENEMLGYTIEDDRTETLANPVAALNEIENISTTSRLLGTVFGQYSILEGLNLKVSFGVDGYFTKENRFAPRGLKGTEGSLGDGLVGTVHGLTWLNENTLNYNTKINENNLDVVVGYTVQKFRSEGVRATALEFTDNRTGWHNLGAGLNPQSPASFESEWGIISYLGRINYSLNDRFLFTLTGRADGASKFGEGNKWGYFPSAAVAWRASNESFMQGLEVFDDLKVRASYGTIGNQSIPPYASLPLLTPRGEGVFNNDEPYKGMEPINYANPDLKWEQTNQFNVGIDAAFFENRISLTADYYHKRTVDLLLNNPVPYTSGFRQTLLNVGNLVNRGFEFEIQTVNTEGEFQWTSGINFSANRNEVTNINQEDDILASGVLFTGVDSWSIIREGQPIGTYYGYIFEGIFQTDEEAQNSPVLVGQGPDASNVYSRAGAGSRKYRDINDDGVIDAEDRTIIGNAQPDFTWGFNNNLSFMNFDLSFFFAGFHGNQLVNFNRFYLDRLSGENNVREEAWLNRWTPENPGNEYPKAQIAGSGNLDVNVFSSAQVEDASFIRLRNVTLGYNLPSSLLERINISRLRIYASGTNLLTFTDYTGYDPEVSHFGDSSIQLGADYGGYPMVKTYTFGLNIGF